MLIKVTEDDILNSRQVTRWTVTMGNYLGISFYGGPIISAVQRCTGRGAKLEFYPCPRLGVLTKCSGGYYMFDLDPRVDLQKHLNFETNELMPFEFELPIEEHFSREVEREKLLQERSFCYSI